MVTTLGWFYLVGGTILFFFWAYGIVSFALDCKHTFVPAIRSWVASRRAGTGTATAERDPVSGHESKRTAEPTPKRDRGTEDHERH